jgi:tight adherence protein C
MLGLVLAVAASCCFALALVGYHFVRTPVAHDFDIPDPRAADAAGASPLLGRLLDASGRRFERVVIGRYGRAHLARLDRRLVRAGRPEGFTARGFLRRKTGFGVVGIVFGILFWAAGQRVLAVALVALCWWWMDYWLWIVANRRQDRLDRELPDFLDVLAVTVSAGLSFRRALERVASSSTGPLAEEMHTVLREMDIGVSRRRAFTHLRERNDAEALGSFVTAVLQAEELGVPLSQALTDLAAEVRRNFAQGVRRRAAKAGPKVSLVVTITIVPAAMLLIGSSLVLANLDSLSGVFGG